MSSGSKEVRVVGKGEEQGPGCLAEVRDSSRVRGGRVCVLPSPGTDLLVPSKVGSLCS